ncbi:hypothetical protein B0J13DRAFT_595705 [Dactylonectria estremocensis]|uniref:BZIP domain-containing protein n=1 Tax=Dactylonectria estremocensis TaxID=1079267 RepID=A0A9P9J4Y4_9HYPO|nr:hypothetical protein B0J13DRAFT_595705 [Dactylonectria estremocensis]
MASYQIFRLVPVRDEVPDENDEWAGLGDVKERRKRQNRLNQRAARRRQRLNGAPELEPGSESAGSKSPSVFSGPAIPARVVEGAASTVVDGYPPNVCFPLTRDAQLLHVISLNVSRAVLTNYVIISSIPLPTCHFCAFPRVFSLPSPEEMLMWSVSGAGVNFTLPPALMPTQIQQQIPHHGWVDLFPYPRLRDNLILALQEDRIDEDAFMMDLVGEAFGSLCGAGEVEYEGVVQLNPDDPQQAQSGSESGQAGINSGEKTTTNDPKPKETWSGDPGLVSWSDPWDINGWEVTEAFVEKWGFLLQGCGDVLVATNVWRDMRDEDPLTVTV